MIKTQKEQIKLQESDLNKQSDVERPISSDTKPIEQLEKKSEQKQAIESQTEIGKKQEIPEAGGAPSSPTPQSFPTIPPIKDLKEMDRKNQIKALLNLALEKDVDSAIAAAKELDNAYVLDELHDSFVDELHHQLIKENKIKKL